MNSCSKVYPFGATAQFIPLFQKSNDVPSTYNGALAQKAQQLNNRVLINIDGKQIPFSPCRYRCSLNHLDSIKPVYFQVGQPYTTLGGVVSAPAYYVQCGGGVARSEQRPSSCT
jgi:hypothetical protein